MWLGKEVRWAPSGQGQVNLCAQASPSWALTLSALEFGLWTWAPQVPRMDGQGVPRPGRFLRVEFLSVRARPWVFCALITAAGHPKLELVFLGVLGGVVSCWPREYLQGTRECCK